MYFFYRQFFVITLSKSISVKQEIDEQEIFEAFRQHLQTMAPVSDNLWSVMTASMRIAKVKKGELLLEEGAICRHIYFIFKGAFRFVHLKDIEEVTTGLFTEGVCMTNMKSLAMLQPSTLFIEALEDSIVIKLSKESLINLYKESSELEGVGRLIMEHMLANDAEWKEIYTIYNPEERYRFLIKKAPQLLQKIPLQYIASFLGIRRETLSRIRKKLARATF